MNRSNDFSSQEIDSVPHTRGDEPNRHLILVPSGTRAFPTPVGMNRSQKPCRQHFDGVPHTRGDEPVGQCGGCNACARSPHPWG